MTLTIPSSCLVSVLLVFGGGAATAQSLAPPAQQGQPATNQTPERKWSIEVHGGLVGGGDTHGGSGILPSSGAIVGRLISLSSVYFGSGAQCSTKPLWVRPAGEACRRSCPSIP